MKGLLLALPPVVALIAVLVPSLAQAEVDDATNWKYVWLTEHHFLTEYSHISANEVMMPHIAARTERIRECSGIINCAQILRDQETNLDLQEGENHKVVTDLWESGQKIAATVNRLRSLQQLYSNPAVTVKDAITLLVSWLELQFPEISQILESNTLLPLPPVNIPGRDLFLAMALQAEQVIPQPGRDIGSCIFSKVHIEADIQSEAEVIIKMILRPKPGKLSASGRDAATHMRERICKELLRGYNSEFEVSRTEDQKLTYRFILRQADR